MSTDRLRLQPLLAFDAATCTAMGALLLGAADKIAALTRLPAPLLFWAGAVLLPIAAFMAVLSRARSVPRWAARLVVEGNAAWALASIALPAFGLIQPNALGWAFLLGQAAVVALLAKLEYAASATAVATR